MSSHLPAADSGVVLIAGCGYVGVELGRRLAERGAQVFGIRRDPASLPSCIRPVPGDVTRPDTLRGLPPAPDAVVYAVSPNDRSDAAYRRAYVEGPRSLFDALRRAGARPRRLVFLSSTGVYGQRCGESVDETTPAEPADARARLLLSGEAQAPELGADRAIVLRLAGLYGPGRTGRVDRVRAGRATCPGTSRWLNLIHRDDAAGAIRHLLSLPEPDALYVGVDLEPAPVCEVLRWIARRIGAPEPRVDAEGGASRRSTNKRCDGGRLRDSGYRFRYPSYRDGYASLLGESPPSTV